MNFPALRRDLFLGASLVTASFTGLTFYAVPELRRSSAYDGWATTDGRVSQSEARAIATRNGTRYEFWFRFRYLVEGRSFESDRYSRNVELKKALGESEAKSLAARYRFDQSVTVHYDPHHPDQALLEIPNRKNAGITLVLGALGLLGGAYFLFSARQKNRASPTSTAVVEASHEPDRPGEEAPITSLELKQERRKSRSRSPDGQTPERWWILSRSSPGKTYGPFSLFELQQLEGFGKLRPNQVCRSQVDQREITVGELLAVARRSAG